MIIKQRDSLRARKLELSILRSFDLPPEKSFWVEQEWRRLLRGERGEKDAAYYLDFECADSDRRALIHDLRLEHKGWTAQIDHLLINRFLDIFVIETKSYSGRLEIKRDGSFVVSYGRKRFSIPSPLEQNRRHIKLLERVMTELEEAPSRMGMRLPVRFENVVLVDPGCEIVRPKGADASNVMHADRFWAWYERRYDSMNTGEALGCVARRVSAGELRALAEKLASLHKAGEFNYRERFGIADADMRKKANKLASGYERPPESGAIHVRERAETSGYYCAACKTGISKNVARFCFDRKERYGGRAYCMDCQKRFR